MSAKQRGVLCVFAAAVLYSIGGLCIKVIPWNGMSINGARTAMALVVIGLYLLGHPPQAQDGTAGSLLGALAVCGTNILFSIANKMTTAANAIVLQFTAPIFVMVFTAIFFRRRPGKLDLVTCAVVLGGVLFFFVDSLADGGMAGERAGPASPGSDLRRCVPDERHAGQRRHLLGLLGRCASARWLGLPFLVHGDRLLRHSGGQRGDPGGVPGGAGLYPAAPSA